MLKFEQDENCEVKNVIDISNLEIASVISKKSNPNGQAIERKTNALNIRLSGSVEYIIDDKRYVVNKGQMMFMPKGSSCTWRVISEGDSHCLIIHLRGDPNTNFPQVFSLGNYIHMDNLSNNFADLWKFGNVSEKFKCYSYLYELLSFISSRDSIDYPEKEKFTIIKPSITYLRKHIYDIDLKIDSLHEMCGISHTYYRKIFIKEMGLNPKEYVVEKRLSHAKAIIESGEMDTVKQLALSVGYDDPLYFSKAFKNKYGVSPARMNSL